jgi:hypothetical protein
LTVHEDSVSALQVANAPLAAFEYHLGVISAHIFVLDAQSALIHAAHPKGLPELMLRDTPLGRFDRYAQ